MKQFSLPEIIGYILQKAPKEPDSYSTEELDKMQGIWDSIRGKRSEFDKETSRTGRKREQSPKWTPEEINELIGAMGRTRRTRPHTFTDPTGPTPFFEKKEKQKIPGINIVSGFLSAANKHKHFFRDLPEQDEDLGLGAFSPIAEMAANLLHPLINVDDPNEDALIRRWIEKVEPPNQEDELGGSGRQQYSKLIRDLIYNDEQSNRKKFLGNVGEYVIKYLMTRINENSKVKIPTNIPGEKSHNYNDKANDIDFSEVVGNDFDFEFVDDQPELTSKKKKKDFFGYFGKNDNGNLANLNVFEKDVIGQLRDVFGFTGKGATGKIKERKAEVWKQLEEAQLAVENLHDQLEINLENIKKLDIKKDHRGELDLADQGYLENFRIDNVELSTELAFYEKKTDYYKGLFNDIGTYLDFKNIEQTTRNVPEVIEYRNNINAFMADSEYVLKNNFVSEEMLKDYWDETSSKILGYTNRIPPPMGSEGEKFLRNNFYGQYEKQKDVFNTISKFFGEPPMQEKTTTDESGKKKIVDLPFDFLKSHYADTPLADKYDDLRGYTPQRLSARKYKNYEDPTPGSTVPRIQRPGAEQAEINYSLNPDNFDPKTRNMLYTLLDSLKEEGTSIETEGMEQLLLAAVTGDQYDSGGYYTNRAVPTLETLYKGKWKKRNYIGDVVSLYGLNDTSTELLQKYLDDINEGIEAKRDQYTWEMFLPELRLDGKEQDKLYKQRIEEINNVLQEMAEDETDTVFGPIKKNQIQTIKHDKTAMSQYSDFKNYEDVLNMEEEQSESASQAWMLKLNEKQKDIASTIGLQRKSEAEIAFAQVHDLKEMWNSKDQSKDYVPDLDRMVEDGTVRGIRDSISSAREQAVNRIAQRKEKLKGDSASFYKRMMYAQRAFDKSGWLDTYRLKVRKEIRDKGIKLNDLPGELAKAATMTRHLRHALNKLGDGDPNLITYDSPNRLQGPVALPKNAVAMNMLSYMVHLMEAKTAAIAGVARPYVGNNKNAPFWKKFLKLSNNYSKNIKKMWGKRNNVFDRMSKHMDTEQFYKLLSSADNVNRMMGGTDPMAGLSQDVKKLLNNYKAGISRAGDKDLDLSEQDVMRVPDDERGTKTGQFIGAKQEPEETEEEADSRLALPVESHEDMKGILANAGNQSELQEKLGEVDVKTRENLMSSLGDEMTEYDLENTFNNINEFSPNQNFMQDGITYLGYVLGNHKMLDANVAEASKQYLDMVYPEKSTRRAVLHRFGEFMLDFLGLDPSSDHYKAMNTEAIEYNKKHNLTKDDRGMLLFNTPTPNDLKEYGVDGPNQFATYQMMRNLMLGGALLAGSRPRKNKLTPDGTVFMDESEKKMYGQYANFMNAFVGAEKMKLSTSDIYKQNVEDPSNISNQYLEQVKTKQKAAEAKRLEEEAHERYMKDEKNQKIVAKINAKLAAMRGKGADNVTQDTVDSIQPASGEDLKGFGMFGQKVEVPKSPLKTEPAPSNRPAPTPPPREANPMHETPSAPQQAAPTIPSPPTPKPATPDVGGGTNLQKEAVSFKGLQTKPSFGNMAQNQKKTNPMKSEFKDNIRRKMTAIFNKESSAFQYYPETGEGETTPTSAKLGKKSYMFNTREHGFEDTWGMREL